MARDADIHQQITDHIVAAIETAPDFRLPWTRTGGGRPFNIASGKPYNGVNVLNLWVSAQLQGFGSTTWGTYRQWQAAGAQVRKGQKSSLVVFYRTIDLDTDDDEPNQRLIARASHVFNADQVDGYAAQQPSDSTFDSVASAEALVSSTGATILTGGDMACNIPATDIIRMPERSKFTGTPTTTPAEGYYSTLFHELTHWTGASNRLDRDMTGRFGSNAYAMEELVAELGAAFLCADLGLTPEPRADHAAYIRSWLAVLKSDKKAVFTAASRASQAANWLTGQGAA